MKRKKLDSNPIKFQFVSYIFLRFVAPLIYIVRNFIAFLISKLTFISFNQEVLSVVMTLKSFCLLKIHPVKPKSNPFMEYNSKPFFQFLSSPTHERNSNSFHHDTLKRWKIYDAPHHLQHHHPEQSLMVVIY